MARTVADAAALLTVLAASDPRDEATREAAAHAVDYTKHLDANALAGARLGVVRSQFGGDNDLVSGEIEKALERLKAAGAVLIEIPALPNSDKYAQSELDVLLYELKADLPVYLAEYAPGARVKTLADVIAFKERHKAKEMPYFEQELFLQAEAKGGLDTPAYLEALASNRKLTREEGIDKVLADNRLDALVAPTGGPAWLIDFIKGDASGGSLTSPAAGGGEPAITFAAGAAEGAAARDPFFWGPRREGSPRLITSTFSSAAHSSRQ